MHICVWRVSQNLGVFLNQSESVLEEIKKFLSVVMWAPMENDHEFQNNNKNYTCIESGKVKIEEVTMRLRYWICCIFGSFWSLEYIWDIFEKFYILMK